MTSIPVYDICRLQTADRRLQTADCRLQTAHCRPLRPQTADCRPQTADCTLKDTKNLTAVGDLQEFFLPLTIILLFGLTLKSTKQLFTPPSDVLVRAGDKQ